MNKNKIVTVTIRLTEEDKKAIIERAMRENYGTISAFMRKIVLDYIYSNPRERKI